MGVLIDAVKAALRQTFPGRLSELDVLIVLVLESQAPRPMTASEIATRIRRYSVRWIGETLDARRGEMFVAIPVGPTTRWNVGWVGGATAPRWPVAALDAEIEAQLARAHFRGRVVRRPSVDDAVESLLARVRRSIERGQFREATRLLDQGGHSLASIEVSSSGGARLLTASVMLAIAEIAMNQGRSGDAIEVADRAIKVAVPGEVELAIRLLAVRGAALRMQGELEAAVASYRRALELAERPGTDHRRGLRRWLSAAISTPLMLRGDVAAAVGALEAARELLVDDDVESIGETRLLEVRLHLIRRRFEDAERLLAEARGRHERYPRWLRGWLARYEVDLFLLSPHRAIRSTNRWSSLELAWSSNDGFGFQRKLVAARAAVLDDDEPASREASASLLRALRSAAARWHKERVGVGIEQCGRCGGRQLGDQLRHALGLAAGGLDPLMR